MTTWNGFAARRFRAWRADLHAIEESCVRFGRLLRSRGIPVSAEQVNRWLRALTLLGCEDPGDLYWSGRITLVARKEHLRVYDELFRRFWLTLDHAALDPEHAPWGGPDTAMTTDRPEQPPRPDSDDEPESESAPLPRSQSAPSSRFDQRQDAAQWLLNWRAVRDASPDGPDLPDDAEPTPGRYSPSEILRRESHGVLKPAEREALRALRAACSQWRPEVRSRRWGPARSGRRPDLRRTLTAAARTGGEPLRVARQSRRRRWRRWVFLCDISGSMGSYLRDVLLMLQVAATHHPRAEVFLFGTRLTRITPFLRRSPPGRFDHLVPVVQDWQGGTRLGQALRTFHRAYARRGMAHGAVLVILSDGLDQGEAGLVGEMMAALRRLTWRIIWVNPLRRSPDYRPEARAMVEALPHVDELLGGHNLASLVDVLNRLAQLG